MSPFHPLWLEHQHKRFTRADAYRLAPPGTPESKPPGWLDPSATRVRLKEAQEDEARALEVARQEELERDFLELRWLVKSLRTDLLVRDVGHKYSPNQPRDELGRWTSEGGAQSTGESDDAESITGESLGEGQTTPPDGESLAQELRRFPAGDQPSRPDRRELEAIANDPLIRAYMDEAWIASNPYGIFPKEHGFWISRDEMSGQLFTRPFANQGALETIVPGSPPPDAIAFFHTHPYGGIQLGAAPPSPQDEALAARMGLPGLIQSHVGVYYFGPPLRPVR